MKTNKIVQEAQYMLTDETRKDKMLQPIDLNVLAVCQYVANYKQLDYNKDGWFILPIAEREKIKTTSIQGYLSKWGVKVSDDTIRRSVNKLMYLGYLDFKKGYYHSSTQSQLSEIKILKGTIPMLKSYKSNVNNSESGFCGNIAVATDTNTKTESKTEKENKSTIEHKLNTYNISTSIGVAEDEQQTTPIEETPMDDSKKDTLIALLHRGDEIETLNWLGENYTAEHVNYIAKWWSNDDGKLRALSNFSNSKAIA